MSTVSRGHYKPPIIVPFLCASFEANNGMDPFLDIVNLHFIGGGVEEGKVGRYTIYVIIPQYFDAIKY